MDDEKRWLESQMTVLWVLAVWLKLGLLQVEAGSCWSRGKWEYLEVSISRLVQRESGQVQVVNGRPDDDCLSEACMSADKWLQVRVINNQLTGSGVHWVWWLWWLTVWNPWHYPLLQGQLLTSLSGNGGCHSLWVQDDQERDDGIPSKVWDRVYHPGSPRITLKVRIHPVNEIFQPATPPLQI